MFNVNYFLFFHLNCSNSDLQTTTSTFVDNVPLILERSKEGSSSTYVIDTDDDCIGEVVRPKPIDSSMDARIQALH